MDPVEKARVLQGLSSIAESGLDFSSRWLKGDQLRSTQIEKLIPTDLITLLGLMEKYLSGLSTKLGKMSLYSKFNDKTTERAKYLNAIKVNDRFPDFNIDAPSSASDRIYPSDFLPFLFLGEKRSVSSIYKDVVNPTASFMNTGHQWDSPNVWAPNNWIIHEVAPADEAREYATQWVHTTYCSWVKHDALFEKYSSKTLGERGEGGEYKTQVGFGWTNGLALHYMRLYPDMKRPDC
jgi:alpha,alpha-trehalase